MIQDIFNINKTHSKIISTFRFFMSSSEYNYILNFQNLVIKESIKNKNYIARTINKQFINNMHCQYIYINDSKLKIDMNKVIKLKYKKNKSDSQNNHQLNISIIIYCNEIKYLDQTLMSIIEQRNFFSNEIIIVYDDLKSLNLGHNFKYKNIVILNNLKKKGIMYSFIIGALASKGKYILHFLTGYTLAKNDILKKLYFLSFNKKIDVLEFNLLINKDDNINESSLNLYKCYHFNSSFTIDEIKYNKNYREIDQDKELLINKLISAERYKKIINKYKLFKFNKIIYNNFEDIIIFLLNNNICNFKHVDIFGVIKNINQINSLKLIQLSNKKEQKIFDSVFFIDFLFTHSSNSYKGKKFVYDKFINILGLAYNKLVPKSNFSIKLLEKFIKCKYINESEKSELIFFYNKLNN